tara:strand:+ start:301 stop:705 length:405 start_codon:yes stop_codon:yes gene_type:complete
MEEQVPNPEEGPMGAVDGPVEELLTENGELNVSEEDAVPPENIRDFADMLDFYQTMLVAEINKNTDAENVRQFCQLYEGISRGCGCQRNARVKKVEEKYLELVNMTEGEQLLIKEKLGAEMVRLFLNGGLFAQF